MGDSKKCFDFLRLNLKCYLIGALSLVVSSILTLTSITCLAVEWQDGLKSHHAMQHVLRLAHLDLDYTSRKLIFGIVLCISTLWIIASLLLIIGVKLNVSGCVLSYFVFGTFIMFFSFLSSLLLLLKVEWVAALMLMGASLIHIHFLVVVHSFYELQIQGKRCTIEDDDGIILIDP